MRVFNMCGKVLMHYFQFLLGVGVATLLANWTNPASTLASNASQAPTDQLNFLLQTVPRAANGAISQRTNEVSVIFYLTLFGSP